MPGDGPTVNLHNEEQEYNSSEDEDFNPDSPTQDVAGSADSSSSDSEEDGNDEIENKRYRTSVGKRGKKKSESRSKEKAKDSGSAPRFAKTKDGDDEIDSGDEVVIQGGKRKRDVATKEEDADYDEAGNDSGEGGLIKTRAQRAKEDSHKQKIPRSKTGSSTVDIDALWKSMNSGSDETKKSAVADTKPLANAGAQTEFPSSIVPKNGDPIPVKEEQQQQQEAPYATPNASGISTAAEEPIIKDGMVKIKRTYEFAGEVTTEERLVRADSFEGRAYIASLSNDKSSTVTSNADDASSSTATAEKKKPPLRRPTKRVSQFDPGNAAKPKATKLTTLEKSRLDWAGYVDRQGLVEELDKQKKAGTGFLERRDFLDRVADRTGGKK